MFRFEDPLDEARFISVFYAFIEEWGEDNVVVSLPRGWKNYRYLRNNRVRFQFCTTSCITVAVEYALGRIEYSVPVRTLELKD